MVKRYPHTFPRLSAIVAFLVSMWCVTAAGSAAESADLTVMSFNIRYSYGKPQEEVAGNDWTDAAHPRRERAVQVIRDNSPDILGLQEARHLQMLGHALVTTNSWHESPLACQFV